MDSLHFLHPLGNLAEKFGGKWIFGGGIFLSGVLTLLGPVAARLDFKLLVALRVLIGMASGPSFPSAAAIWGKWVPIRRRNAIVSHLFRLDRFQC